MDERPKPAKERARPRARYWLLVLGLVAVAAVTIITPVAWIMPFKAQTPNKLEMAYLLRRMSPIGVPLIAAAVLALTVYLWRGGRWWGRSFLVVLCSVMMLFAWFAQQNHFEWMFHPLPKPGFAQASAVDYVGDSEMVLAVASNGESAAYPIRQIAYHHVVQDTVGGLPLVVTY